MLKRLARNLLSILWGIVLGVLMLEIGLRIFPALLPGPLLLERSLHKTKIYANDEYLIVKQKPNLDILIQGHPDFSFRIKTVSLGFPDIGFREDGIDDSPYGVVVGDSFVWGYGVEMEETFTELMENRTGLDFVNLGVTGYSSIQYQRVLEQYGMVLSPEVIVWGFYVNDIKSDGEFEEKMQTNVENVIVRQLDTMGDAHGLDFKAGEDYSIVAWIKPRDIYEQEALLNQGLVAYWPFDTIEDQQSPDATGNGYHADLYGPVLVTGQNGNALSFDGKDDYAHVTMPNFKIEQDFTVSAWVKISDSSASKNIIAYKKPKSGRGFALFISKDGRVAVGDGISSLGRSEEKVNDGRWHHVVVVYIKEQNAVKLWIGGRASKGIYLEGSRVDLTAKADWYLGGTRDGKTFNGLLDEIRFYGRALDETTIRDLVQKNSRNRPNGTIISKQADRGYSLSIDPEGFLLASVNDGHNNTIAQSDIRVVAGRWHHVVATVDRDAQVTFYIDGEIAGAASISQSSEDLSNEEDFCIGGDKSLGDVGVGTDEMSPHTDRPQTFDGIIDEINIYGKALTEAEARELLQAQDPSGEATAPIQQPHLIACWKFDEGAGYRAADAVGINDALVDGAIWVPAKLGSGLKFDGIDDFARVPFSQRTKTTTLDAIHGFGQEHILTYQLLSFLLGDEKYKRFTGHTNYHYYNDQNLALAFAPWVGSTHMNRKQLIVDPYMERGWELTQQSILQAKQIADDAGAIFIVLIIPFKEQAYWHVASQYYDPKRHCGGSCDPDWITNLVRDFCETHDIQYVDLVPIFKQHAQNGEQLYFHVDGHINQQGHRVVAQSVLDYLSQENLIEPAQGNDARIE